MKKVKRKHISINKRDKVYLKYDNKCAYCGEPLTETNKSIDHIIPIFSGGTNDINNLNPACIDCNKLKANLTITEFKIKINTALFNYPTNKLIKYYDISINNNIVFYYEKLKNKQKIQFKVIRSKTPELTLNKIKSIPKIQRIIKYQSKQLHKIKHQSTI